MAGEEDETHDLLTCRLGPQVKMLKLFYVEIAFAIKPIRKLDVVEMGDQIRPGAPGKFSHIANFINCLARNSTNIDIIIIQLANIAINAHGYWRILQNRFCF